MKPLIAFAVLILAVQESPQDILTRMTNDFRAKEDLPALKKSELLTKVAQGHAENMARQDIASHDLDGKSFQDRVEATEYKWSILGENVAANLGMPDPVAAAVKGWYKSPGHNKNMMSKDFQEIGVGFAKSKSGKNYFVQVFARPR